MKSVSFTAYPLNNLTFRSTKSETCFSFLKTSKQHLHLHLHCFAAKRSHTTVTTTSVSPNNDATLIENMDSQTQLEFTSTASLTPPLLTRNLSFADQAFFLLTFIAFTTSVAFVGLVTAAVPTLRAMGRTAISLSKLVDTAREELPSTMAAVRLSGMEISDLTLELSDLSHEITDGVTKSAQAVQAAEVGIRQVGSLAREKTISMIEERANLPEISLQLLVNGAARKTSKAVEQATKTLVNKISGYQGSSGNKDDNGADNLSEDDDNVTMHS